MRTTIAAIVIVLFYATDLFGQDVWKTQMYRRDHWRAFVSANGASLSMACKVGQKGWVGVYFSPRVPFAKHAREIRYRIGDRGAWEGTRVVLRSTKSSTVEGFHMPKLEQGDGPIVFRHETEDGEWAETAFPLEGAKDALDWAAAKCRGRPGRISFQEVNLEPSFRKRPARPKPSPDVEPKALVGEKWRHWANRNVRFAGGQSRDGSRLRLACEPGSRKWVLLYFPPKPVPNGLSINPLMAMRFPGDPQEEPVWVRLGSAALVSQDALAAPVVWRLKAASAVTLRYEILDGEGYRASEFSLAGSDAAIGLLEKECGTPN